MRITHKPLIEDGSTADAAAEIAEAAWVAPTNPDRELAHLLHDEVFPALES